MTILVKVRSCPLQCLHDISDALSLPKRICVQAVDGCTSKDPLGFKCMLVISNLKGEHRHGMSYYMQECLAICTEPACAGSVRQYPY